MSSHHLEGNDRAAQVEGLKDARVHLAEPGEHAGPQAQAAGSPRVVPLRRVPGNLEIGHWSSEVLEQCQGVGLGVEQVAGPGAAGPVAI